MLVHQLAALLIYNGKRRQHVNKSGFVFHGSLDKDAIGQGAKTVPYICDEIQQQTMALIYLGNPEETILQNHIESVQRYCGSNSKVSMSASEYVRKMGLIFRRSTHELEVSIRLWMRQIQIQVILSIQTEWQLQQMIRSGHHSLMAADSTFGIKKLKVGTRSIDSAWKINGFMIDDAAADGRCLNVLGELPVDVMEEFIQDFVDQTPSCKMWLTTMRSLPLDSQEASDAIEGYHLKLKLTLSDDSHLGSLQRVDWLVHKLNTELHPSYWFNRYADEIDSFQTVKADYIASSSWHRASQIPENAKDRLFAKVISQKDTSQTHMVGNDCSWSLQGNLCKHVIKVNLECSNIGKYFLKVCSLMILNFSCHAMLSSDFFSNTVRVVWLIIQYTLLNYLTFDTGNI
ncbi:hypothetical protein MKW98_016280 [Papaver atlanticum]|uniref:SWIM-type domain-containing protein n=1 Tax=Papaver atlanticum TaxID=357466 RepID=A0AAD4XEW8_9MAGN|nr:hypothetical protein MKW98_016280 [Papaver atlanticum]